MDVLTEDEHVVALLRRACGTDLEAVRFPGEAGWQHAAVSGRCHSHADVKQRIESMNEVVERCESS